MCGERDIEGWGAAWGWGHHRDGNGDTVRAGDNHKGWGQGCGGTGGTVGMEMVAPRCWGWGLGSTERLGSQQGWSQGQHGAGVSQDQDHHGIVDANLEYQDSGALRTRYFIHQPFPTQWLSASASLVGLQPHPSTWTRVFAATWHYPAVTGPCPHFHCSWPAAGS